MKATIECPECQENVSFRNLTKKLVRIIDCPHCGAELDFTCKPSRNSSNETRMIAGVTAFILAAGIIAVFGWFLHYYLVGQRLTGR